MITHYSKTAKFLHWLIASAIFGLFFIGFTMADMELSPEKLQYYSWHKWAGVTVFILTIARLTWRLFNPAPPLPEQMNKHLKLLAHLGHIALYFLCIIVPLSGWLMSSAKGVQTVWFGVWPIPDLISRDRVLGNQLQELHEVLNWALLALICTHVLAALKHHFIDKDQILKRMLPSISPSKPRNEHV
jgi:cytochrome b561